MKRFAALALAALLGAADAIAQAPAPAQQPSFRSSTVVVEVDALVTDGEGRFVPGLTADDFDVFEDGKLQRIDRIYAVTGTTVTAPPVSSDAASPPEAVAPAAVPPRVFVLLFDQEHMQPGSFKRLQDAAIGFLTKEFKPGDVGGVVIGSAMAGNRLTSDREALLTAVRNAKPDFAKASLRLELLEWPRFANESEAVRIALSNDRNVLGQVVRRACSDDAGACKNIDPEPLVLGKAQTIVGELRPPAMRTVRALQGLASGLARLPGRKTIILMTDGFFIEESWGDLRQIVGTAARSNVRIYSLDSRGMDTRQVNDPRQISVMDPGGSMPLEAYNTLEDGPNMLAVDTGGYPIRHTNNFTEALSDIARDTSNYYVIGYRATHAASDGSFHAISVKVKRQGLTVRARRGYLAAASTASTTAQASVPAPAPAATAPAAALPAAPIAAGPPAAPVVTEPAVSGGAAPVPAPAATAPAERSVAPALALRPDSSNRVNELAAREGGAGSDMSLASQGWDRYQKGDLEGAATLLQKATADSNVRPWVRYALGYADLGLRQFEQAAQEWERVRAAVPEFRPVYLDLADAYLQLGGVDRAIGVLRVAEASWPGDLDVLNAMGTLQVRRGALDDAIGTFKKAVQSQPDDGLAYFNLGRTYELRYFKTRRYSKELNRWLANQSDVKDAVAAYEEYVKLGGPFVDQATRALQNLKWVK
jgi:VWFA-related protein